MASLQFQNVLSRVSPDPAQEQKEMYSWGAGNQVQYKLYNWLVLAFLQPPPLISTL